MGRNARVVCKEKLNLICMPELKQYKEHLILTGSPIRQALARLDYLSTDAILFVVNDQDQLIGSLTDGDVRRGLLKGVTIDEAVDHIIQPNPKYIQKGANDIQKVIDYRNSNFRVLPVLDKNGVIVNVINFRLLRSYLPVDAVIMAGGRGERLRPLTEKTPKPLLPVGGKPIMQHNLERLALYGIDDFWFSVNYLADQIETYFGDGHSRNIQIEYIREENPMGTIGSVAMVQHFEHDYILVTNSDILTNLDYEHFFIDTFKKQADLAVVTIPYQVNVPYAVLETHDGQIQSLKEKPTYTYYSNGGIYLMKKEVLSFIPQNAHFNATDLIESLIHAGKKVSSYPLLGYWLDIGNPDDYQKAQQDLPHIQF